HLWCDGTPRPWKFMRAWHLEPSLTERDTVYAGVEDAALFKSTDGGQTWKELAALRQHETGPTWAPAAGGTRLATTRHDPTTPASQGARSAATCRPTSASPSRSTPTSRRPSTWFRSRAIRITYLPTESSASTAADPAATSGSLSPGDCPSATATSTCCATPW